MLKKGFTLQELLISLAVIGVVSAVALPSLMSIQPDKSKTIYMKAYNTLTTLTDEILNDPSLYYETYDSNGNVNCQGLRCVGEPSASYTACNQKWQCLQATKFSAIFATKVNYTQREHKDDIVTFTTLDGANWSFTPTTTTSELIYDITINIKPTDHSKNNPCSYSTTCLKPNEFKFRIDNDGGIRPADALGMAYLQNPTDTRSGATDRNLAAQIVKDAKSATDIDKMSTALTEIIKKQAGSTTKTTTTDSESK